MGIFDRLFGKSKRAPDTPGKSAGAYSESDNAGTRQTTVDQATTYWSMRNMRQKFDPFVLYMFDDEAAARRALLELDCVHEAHDTGDLICTQPLVFGCYRTESGQHEAIIAGEQLSHDLWAKAKERFEAHGGRRKNDQEPDLEAGGETEKAPSSPAAQVEFVSKDRKGDNVYELYRCADAEAAKDFLLGKTVDKQLYYIVVQTPMGNWGTDIKGLYKESLLPWQSDVASAEVEGQAVGFPDMFSLQMAARGMNNNFPLAVECGSCSRNWVEGLRYKAWTVVQCPACGKKNKVSTEHITVILA